MKPFHLAVLAALAPTSVFAQQGAKFDSTAPIKAAGSDVTRLLQLAAEWTEQKHAEGARAAWKRVIEIDRDNAVAREGLHHQFYDGKWWESRTALFDFQRAEDERMAKQGLARLKDTWVPIADAPFLKLGWERDAKRGWLSPLTKVRLDREQELTAKGWQQQDLEWVPPEQFESWKKGLWKCGEDWLDNEAANAWHADANRPWYVASEHFVISTTVERDRVEWCKWYADQTYADLMRLFGVEPGARPSAVDLFGPQRNKPELHVLRNLEQFNKVAASAGETDGFSSLHYAYFADALYDTSVKPAAYAGIGVGFWDNSNKTLDGFGQYSIRHAAALSFVEAIDPSWKALGDMAMGVQAKSTSAFWAEKKIPRWLRYGAASYVERYFLDKSVGDAGNARWSREWALSSLKQAGGLRDIQKVFDFKLALADQPGSTQLIHEAGLLVAFLLDGEDKQVQKAHQAFVQVLRAGGNTAVVVADLQKALLASKAAIAKFANG
jgi:hypothetical protein